MHDGTGYSVVWFKRDLRLHDHAALCAAARRGPVLCLYIVEPGLWATPDAARQHYHFTLESLRDLYRALRQLGGQLHVVTGAALAVLARLHALAPFDSLYSHEETGNDASYRRDRSVARWCRSAGVLWQEFPQFGVVRRLADRDHWQRQWDDFVARPCLAAPPALHCRPLPWIEPPPPGADALGLPPEEPAQRQRGGRHAGLAILEDFLVDRSARYRGGISSPLSAPTACSRLSPYLASGCLSLREIVHATRRQLAALAPSAARQRAGLTAFISRLYWHCHFIQKLESEPTLEYRNLHRGYNGLREDDWNSQHFSALTAGRTGWPLVDACVAMLRETGWINFRMRAMLVSVAAYPLWLHWRPVGLWLARQFLDYEPGIHWPQMQMQAGTTGINVPRIYNPLKQARDHDPHGHFVRRWLPYLRQVPDAWLFEPWRMPAELQVRHGLRPGVDIPLPPVDLEAATRAARARLFAMRADPAVRAAKASIVERHGSRKKNPAGSAATTGRKVASSQQLRLEL
jgi:deoxyribodipyrimidine photo-lyase